MKRLTGFQKWYITELVKIEIEEVDKEVENMKDFITKNYKLSSLKEIIEILKPKGVK